MATASISLVREQSEQVQPPRALWVTFPLGRPLGVADDPGFQLDVVRGALDMLATATEPTIEDHPIDAPSPGPEVWACPLNLPVDPDESLGGRVRAEVDRLRPWATETRRRRGRTLFGASGAAPDQVDEVVDALVGVAESGDLATSPTGEIEWAHPMPLLIRHLVDDLRGFVHEGLAAQPGSAAPTHDDLNNWIFGDVASGGTAFGELLLTLGDHLTAAGEEDPMAMLVRGLVIPEGRYHGQANFKGLAGYDD